MSNENSTPNTKPTPPKPQIGGGTVPPKAPNLQKPSSPKIGTGNTAPPVPPSSGTSNSSVDKPKVSGTPIKSTATDAKFSVTKSPFQNTTKSTSQFKVTQSPFTTKTSKKITSDDLKASSDEGSVAKAGSLSGNTQFKTSAPLPPSQNQVGQDSKTPWAMIALSGIVAIGSVVLLVLLFQEFNSL